MARPKVIKAIDNSDAVNTKVVSLREVDRPTIKADGLLEKITNDKFHYVNYYYTGGDKKFPMAPEMWVVDKYYPYADGGAIAVDEANYQQDVNTLMLKKQILRESGVRYICISNGMSEMEIMEQLA